MFNLNNLKGKLENPENLKDQFNSVKGQLNDQSIISKVDSEVQGEVSQLQGEVSQLQSNVSELDSQVQGEVSNLKNIATDKLLSKVPKSLSTGIKLASLIKSGLIDKSTPQDKFRQALLLLSSNNEFKKMFSKAVNTLIADAVYKVLAKPTTSPDKALAKPTASPDKATASLTASPEKEEDKPECEIKVNEELVTEIDVKKFFEYIIILNNPIIESHVEMLYKLNGENLYNYFYVEEEKPESYDVSNTGKAETVPDKVNYDLYDGLLKIFIKADNDFSNILKQKLAPIVNKRLETTGKQLKINNKPFSFDIFSVSDGFQLAVVELVKAIICKGKKIFYENPDIAYEQKNNKKVVGGRKTKKRRKRGFLIKGGVIGEPWFPIRRFFSQVSQKTRHHKQNFQKVYNLKSA